MSNLGLNYQYQSINTKQLNFADPRRPSGGRLRLGRLGPKDPKVPDVCRMWSRGPLLSCNLIYPAW